MKIVIVSAPHRKIPVTSILPNPHRDLKANPPKEERVEELIESFERTGFWDNIVVREHPTREDKFQLAYGHNRLAALKNNRVEVETITIPVATLNDWDMYCAMVDENEMQGTITPAVQFENIGRGCDLIEAAFNKIGKDGTFQDFNEAIGRVVPLGTTLRDKHDGGFEQARNAYFAGEGLGRVFLAAYLPCGHVRPQTISAVLESRYGAQRKAAQERKAAEKERAAKEKRKKAKSETDENKKKKLEDDADKDDAEAAKLKAAAAKINFIERDILLKFKTPNMMTDFADAIKKEKIPSAHHLAAAEMILKANVMHDRIRRELAEWWDIVSGDRARRQIAAQREKERDQLKKLIKGTDFTSFLNKLCNDLRDNDAEKRLKIAIEHIHLADDRGLKLIENKMVPIIAQYQTLIDRARETIKKAARDVTPATKMLSHRKG